MVAIVPFCNPTSTPYWLYIKYLLRLHCYNYATKGYKMAKPTMKDRLLTDTAVVKIPKSLQHEVKREAYRVGMTMRAYVTMVLLNELEKKGVEV